MARILVVDDEKCIRITLREFLIDDQHEVFIAGDADQALKILEENLIDVVVTDIILPRISGVNLLHEIRSISSQVQVIMMTGEPTVDTAAESLRSGAYDYLYKPINKEEILKTVKNAARIKDLDDQKRALQHENLRYQQELEKIVAERTCALMESERRYHTYLTHAPLAIFIFDETGRYIDVNPAACGMTGYTINELINLSFTDLLNSKEHERGRLYLKKVQLMGKALDEFSFCCKDGQKIYVFKESVKITSKRYIAFCRDITESKRAQKALFRHKQEFMALVENAPDIIIRYDEHLNYLYVNPAIEKATGISSFRFIGKNICDISLNKQTDEIWKNTVEKVLDEKTPQEIEFSLDKGDKRFYFNARFVPEYNEEGKLSSVLGIARDITEHKLAEQESSALQAQLLQSQKMESIGKLAGGIAHDFNNLLMPILGHTESLLVKSSYDDPHYQSLIKIMKAGESARNLIFQLLSFSRKQELEFRILELGKFIDRFVNVLRHTMRENIEINLQDLSSGARIKGDSGRIEQIMMNLAINAQEAMKSGGTFTIEIAEREAVKGIDEGKYVLLKVSDTGEGMLQHVCERIFEPFYTTKEEGTGLGLSTVYGIVKQHNAHIFVKSEKNQGTHFEIYFPKTEENIDDTELPTIEEKYISNGKETILVVEDEEMVREMACLMLSSKGYNVFSAGLGSEALLIMEEHGDKIDLLLADVVMPYMSGKELYEKLAKKYPNLKIIYMSGYPDYIIDYQKTLGENFLRKPFTVLPLSKKVREVLDQK